MYSRAKKISPRRNRAPCSKARIAGDCELSSSAGMRPNSSTSCCCARERITFAPGGNADSPNACSGEKLVLTTYRSAFLLTLATSRRTAWPFRGPRPVSTTSVPVSPTMMPMFGTRGTLPSGMTNTCSETLTVVFSLTTGSPGAGGCCAATSETAKAHAAATAAYARFMRGILPSPPRTCHGQERGEDAPGERLSCGQSRECSPLA